LSKQNGHGPNGIVAKQTSNGTVPKGTQNGASARFPLLFPLTAADENGIRRQAVALYDHIEKAGEEVTCAYLQDMAFTLSKKRTVHPWKSFALGSTAEELKQSLTRHYQKPIRSSLKPLISFVFTGQGAQWASMGLELLQHRVYKESMDYADGYFRSLGATWSLLGE
jgi:acyl transferase domain-containing protein